MKTSLLFSGALLCAALSLPATLQAALTVHEWGTFTILQGSDGQALRWYQPHSDYHKLPAFVRRPQMNGFAFKATAPDGAALARMETPVLYFYPDAELDISVTASMSSGRITEWFPHGLNPGVAAGQSPRALQWIGRLLAPDSPLASSIPRSTDDAGKHYDFARNVPDAWLFRSSLPKPAPQLDPADPRKELPAVPQLDRMIFYRGAADPAVPLLISTADDTTFSIHNASGQPVAAAFAVQAGPQGIAWTRLDGLQPTAWVDGAWQHIRSFTFPPAAPREEAAAALRKAVTETLVTEGLTPAEAAAMVATWQDLWFMETGTRVLSILPDDWVASTVPLSIEPQPDKLERVYVLRTELLTKARENTLAQLLAAPGDPAAGRPAFAALELGRFAQGALLRAKTLLGQQHDQRFTTLSTNP